MFESKTVIDMEQTGINLRNYMRANGYSVKDIQKYLGLSCPQPVYRWFKGVILPSVDNLLRLSELFGVHMEDLLVRKGPLSVCVDCTDMDMENENAIKRILVYYSKMAA